MVFLNRKDASEKLTALLHDQANKNVVVLGIPRGGAETAYYLAKYLNAELSVVISKKIEHPQYNELGIGSICEGGMVYLPGQDYFLDAKDVERSISKCGKEIARRISLYRNQFPLPDLVNRTVIITDDGIATGVTMVPVIRLCRHLKAAKIIVAAPVSSSSFDTHLNEADELRILHSPADFMAVGQFYHSFPQLTDEDVLFFLKDYPSINFINK